MLYYTDSARMSAIENIRECIDKVMHVSGEQLDYITARRITAYLNMLVGEIKKESREEKKR